MRRITVGEPPAGLEDHCFNIWKDHKPRKRVIWTVFNGGKYKTTRYNALIICDDINGEKIGHFYAVDMLGRWKI